MNTNKKFNCVKTLGAFLSIFFILVVGCSAHWCNTLFKRVNFDEIGIVLSTGAAGTDSNILNFFIKDVLLLIFVVALWFSLIFIA